MSPILKPPSPPPDRAELVPLKFDPDLIVTPDGNPLYTPAMLDDLLESIRLREQLVPGYVCPSPDLPENKRLCLEGNRRLQVCRLLGRTFWAFDLGRFAPEQERIELTFQHNLSRRVMTPEEIADRAARWMEITGSTAAEAAKQLNVSPPTLSRAFGEKRIPRELRARAGLIGQSIRYLIATAPRESMAEAVAFAETPGPDGKTPTRDQVALFIRQLKTGGKGNGGKPKLISLRLGGRTVSFSVADADDAASVSKDLKAIIERITSKENAHMEPKGWRFLFK